MPAVLDDGTARMASWNSLRHFNVRHMGAVDVPTLAGAAVELLLTPTVTGAPLDAADVPTTDTTLAAAGLIPELPYGQEIGLEILSNWGDRHYAGLTGIEIFDADGHQVRDFELLWADPADVNVAGRSHGLCRDPRVIKNLVNTTNITTSELHMWLAPFCAGATNKVTLRMAAACRVAMLRVYNYNASRVHASRGVRRIRIRLDHALVFDDEIAAAPGGINFDDPSTFGEIILFSQDLEVLEKVAAADPALAMDLAAHPAVDPTPEMPSRPLTSQAARPATTQSVDDTAPSAPAATASLANAAAVHGQFVQIVLASAWGSDERIGLTALEILGRDMQPLNIVPLELGRAMAPVPALALVDGVHAVTNRRRMWLASLCEEGGGVQFRGDLGGGAAIAGVRIWNWNCPEDLGHGVKIAHVLVDGVAVSPAVGLLVRKAPGHCRLPFAQTIRLDGGTLQQHAAALASRSDDNDLQQLEECVMPGLSPRMAPATNN